MAGVHVKRSRGFTEVRLNVSQERDTAARKQNKILTNHWKPWPHGALHGSGLVEHKPHFAGENSKLERVCCWETKIKGSRS